MNITYNFGIDHKVKKLHDFEESRGMIKNNVWDYLFTTIFDSPYKRWSAYDGEYKSEDLLFDFITCTKSSDK